MKSLSAGSIHILDFVSDLIIFNAVSYDKISIPVDDKAAIIRFDFLTSTDRIIVSAALSQAFNIILFILIAVLDLYILLPVIGPAGPGLDPCLYIYTAAVCKFPYISGKDPYRIGIGITGKGRQRKRSDHAQSYKYGCRFDK